GSKVCAECHVEHATSYAQHPMGRSFAPLAEVAAEERYDAAANNAFEHSGTLFRVERDGPHVKHKVRRPASGATPIFAIENEPAFVMGSRSHGRAYLINHDGFLYQSPISWFSQKNAWDISPGYDAELLFDRPIQVRCLFCHCNDARPVPHTTNRFQQPLVTET